MVQIRVLLAWTELYHQIFGGWEIFEIYSDVNKEASFSQKVLTNGVNIGLPQRTLVETTVHRVETRWLSSKESVPGEAVGKEGLADSLEHEDTYHYWFPWKKNATVNSVSYCQLFWQNSPYLLITLI